MSRLSWIRGWKWRVIGYELCWGGICALVGVGLKGMGIVLEWYRIMKRDVIGVASFRAWGFDHLANWHSIM